MARFNISHSVRRIAQRRPTDCWAAALAMARGEIRGQRLTVAGVRQRASQAGVRLTLDGSLPPGDFMNTHRLATAVYMILREVPSSGLTMPLVRTLLANRPLVILGEFVYPSRGTAQNHAITVYRFVGDDRNPGTTRINFVDPFDARTFEFSWTSFVNGFVATADYILWR